MDLVIILSRKADGTDIKIKLAFHFTISKNPFLLPFEAEKSLQNTFLFKYIKGGSKYSKKGQSNEGQTNFISGWRSWRGNSTCVREQILSLICDTKKKADTKCKQFRWEEQVLISSSVMWKSKGKQMPNACSYEKICLVAKYTFKAISGHTAVCTIVMWLNSSGELLNIYLNFAVGINSTISKLSWSVLMSKREEISNITPWLAMLYSHTEDKVLQECYLSAYTVLFQKITFKRYLLTKSLFCILDIMNFLCLFDVKVSIDYYLSEFWRSNVVQILTFWDGEGKWGHPPATSFTDWVLTPVMT